ncbi:MAG TPA: hypothetical protein DDW52_24110 [Planctomycetaceae bacterium]|nr:hypothetical protein [Planctomycetaceae bacterium]
MRRGHTILRESGERLAAMLRRERYQPPKRDTNTRPVPGGVGETPPRFAKLIEDMPEGHGRFAYARTYSWAGAELGTVKLHNWGDASAPAKGLMDHAKAGYYGIATWHKDRWRGDPAECIRPCYASGYLELGTIPNATVGSPWSYTPMMSELTGLSLSGAPEWLSIDSETGELSGTPDESGEVLPIVSGFAPKIGPGIVAEDEYCALTRVVPIAVLPAE